jgi:hypothetical protein
MHNYLLNEITSKYAKNIANKKLIKTEEPIIAGAESEVTIAKIAATHISHTNHRITKYSPVI